MMRCFQLAERGLGHVAPNPMVGCVIVKEGRVIGEGFHREFGKNHAEINAIESVKNDALLNGSDLYVNLEPCTHYGKTPPCADKIIEKGIKRVFIAGSDPSEKVKGKGIQKLRENGISVESGILFNVEKNLNKRFRTYYEKKRPYIILKWAETKDGFMDIDRANGKVGQFVISNEASRRLSHKWRSEEQAILIGSNTALVDDPSLNVRFVDGKNPLRLIIDLNCRLSKSLKIFNDGIKTIIYSDRSEEVNHLVYVETDKNKVLETILKDLHQREIQSVIVEGGQKTLHSFISAGLWDEARVFRSGKNLGFGLSSPDLKIEARSVEDIMGDELRIYLNNV